jgi:MFS family permease
LFQSAGNGIIIFVRNSGPAIIPIHYGWVIVVVGTLSIFACLGLGRFALGMLLPSMATSLNLSYAEMGFISTGNFVGYLVAVLVCGFWVMRIGARKLIFLALLLIGCTMILSGMAQGFLSLLIIYTLTGIGSGAANVPVMALVTSWFTSRMRGRASGFVVIGSGFAIILSGKLVPFINTMYGAEGWRTGWYLLGSTVIIIAILAFILLRDRPEEKGLMPIGSDVLIPAHPRSNNGGTETRVYKKGILYHLGAIYFLFGYTYVIYATFIVTTLVKERGFPEAIAGNFWAILGFLSLFSGPVFGSLSDKLGRKKGFIIVFSLQMTSYLLIASGLSGAFLYLSIGLYGIVAWSIPSIMAAAVGDYAGPEKMTTAFGLVTFIFGFGQIAGPAVAGMLAERQGGFAQSFLMAAAFAGLAIVLSLFLRKPKQFLLSDDEARQPETAS